MYEKDIKICESYTGNMFYGNPDNIEEVQEYLRENYGNAMYNAHLQMLDNYMDQL